MNYRIINKEERMTVDQRIDCSQRSLYLLSGIFMVIVTLAISGCGGGEPERAPARAKSAASAADKPRAAAEEEYVPLVTAPRVAFNYNPVGRRDPFRSILVKTEIAKSLEGLPPLQKTDLEELRLIGIVWGNFGYSAMVQTPDGKGYSLRVGTQVGPNEGSVKRITKRFLLIEEKYTDIFGESKTREVKFDLHPQKEGSE